MSETDITLKNRRNGLLIGQVVFILFMMFDIFLFFNKTGTAPKLIAAGSFVLLLILSVISFREMVRLHK